APTIHHAPQNSLKNQVFSEVSSSLQQFSPVARRLPYQPPLQQSQGTKKAPDEKTNKFIN
ncbi:MAG: hypothetical protein ACKPJJ_07795, partial [Planctomycetaceae bacterium]